MSKSKISKITALVDVNKVNAGPSLVGQTIWVPPGDQIQIKPSFHRPRKNYKILKIDLVVDSARGIASFSNGNQSRRGKMENWMEMYFRPEK